MEGWGLGFVGPGMRIVVEWKRMSEVKRVESSQGGL